MALTLDGNAMLPNLGTGSEFGMGSGALGGGILGLLAGMLLTGRGGFWGNGVNGGPLANAATTDIVMNPAFQSLQQQIAGISSAMNTNSTNAEIDNVARSIESANLANLQGIASNALTYQAGNANVLTELANGNFTTLNSINGLGRDIVASNTQALINNLQNFNNLSAQVATGNNQIIAGQNAQNAQMAACCCDIKQTISAEGAATRALINDLNVQNLRDQLIAANTKVSNNEQNQYLLSTILAHVKPIVQ